VPPRWKIEPTDVSVERNRHITLHCQADGVPTPTVIWKKATGKTSSVNYEQLSKVFFAQPFKGSKSGDYEEIREKPYTKLLSNGSLLLQHVKEDREGFYICQANNGIGTGIGKVIQLKVNCTFASLTFLSTQFCHFNLSLSQLLLTFPPHRGW
jgi:Immunoglobulin domain